MTIEQVNPAELAKPSGFSHAVVAEGRVIFLAGHAARIASSTSSGNRSRFSSGPP